MLRLKSMATVLIGLVAIMFLWQWSTRSIGAAEAEAKAARAATTTALRHSANAVQFAADAQLQANSFRADRIVAVRQADSLRLIEARLRGTIASTAVPDTCRPLVILYDSTLAVKDGTEVKLRVALAKSDSMGISLQHAVDTLSAALTELRGAAHALVKADEKVARRSLLLRLLPRPGVGVSAGFDPLGKPTILYGVHVGWSF